MAVLEPKGTAWGVGDLSVRAPFDLSRYEGRFVALTGPYARGTEMSAPVLTVETISPDLLATDPVSYFGSGSQLLHRRRLCRGAGRSRALCPRRRDRRRRTVRGPGSRPLHRALPGARAVISLSAIGLERTGRNTGGWMPDSLNGRPVGRTPAIGFPAGRGPQGNTGGNGTWQRPRRPVRGAARSSVRQRPFHRRPVRRSWETGGSGTEPRRRARSARAARPVRCSCRAPVAEGSGAAAKGPADRLSAVQLRVLLQAPALTCRPPIRAKDAASSGFGS